MTLFLYGHFTEAKLGKTGLTVAIDVYRVDRSSGTSTLIVSGGTCIEIGGGLYRYLLASADLTLYDYIAVLKTATDTVDIQHVPALWTRFSEGSETRFDSLDSDNADLADQLTTIQNTVSGDSFTVTVVSPVAEDGTIQIVRGDDYFAADGRSIDIVITGGHDLTGATAKLTSRKGTVTWQLSSVSILTPAGSSKTIRFESSRSETKDLAVGSWKYDVEVTLSNTHSFTPQIGEMGVVADVSPNE